MAKIGFKSELVVYLSLAALVGCLFSERLSHARLAEQLRAEKKYSAAIQEYERHISVRLSAPGRDPGENPYFYKLLIGDVYLESGDFGSAETSYLEALNNGVDKEFVASKMRGISGKLSEQGKAEDAMSLLRKHRDLDPLMSDLEIDRIFKTTLTSTP
jgi:tetratricopeptide (TPR) repeat protein